MAPRSALINVMTRAAEKAARGLRRDFGEVEQLQVSLKGPGNFVSTADLKAERVLRQELSKARPDYSFLMEESGASSGKDADHRWIVDPLDGTTNFLHGLPHFCISVALERAGDIVAGVVFDPIKDELFWGEKGIGAFLNDRRLRVSSRRQLSQALVATGTPMASAATDGRATCGSSTASWIRLATSAAWARPPSISPMSRPDGSMATGNMGSAPGTSPPACCWCARPAAM